MSSADVAALRAKYVTACAASPWGEAAAVAVLLAYEPVASRPEFARHVTRGGVGWDKVLAEAAWHPEARFLIASAAGLWTGSPHGADVCAVARLDDDEAAAWLAMVTARLTGKVPDGSDEGSGNLDHYMSCPCGRGDYDLCVKCPYAQCSVHGGKGLSDEGSG